MLEKPNLRHSVDFLHVNLSTTISRPRRSIFLGYINVLRYVFFNKNMNPDHFLKNISKNDMNSDHFLKPNSTNDLKIFYGAKKKSDIVFLQHITMNPYHFLTIN